MERQHTLRILFAVVLVTVIAGCETVPSSGPAALAGQCTNSLGTVWTINPYGTSCSRRSKVVAVLVPSTEALLRRSPRRTPLQQIEINFFQPLRLRGQVEILAHCAASRVPDAPKKTGILCCIEQRSR